MQLVQLFPTGVGIFNLDRELSNAEKQFLVNLPKNQNILNQISVATYVLNHEVLQDLKVFLDKCLKEYFDAIYDPSTECSLKITQSWCNYSGDGDGHHSHFHPNSIVSGVFYIQTTDLDKIIFYREHQTHHEIRIDPKHFHSINANSWWLPTKQYSLVLFPSTLRHSVDNITRDETRISLSFNTFFSGTVGSNKHLTELILP